MLDDGKLIERLAQAPRRASGPLRRRFEPRRNARQTAVVKGLPTRERLRKPTPAEQARSAAAEARRLASGSAAARQRNPAGPVAAHADQRRAHRTGLGIVVFTDGGQNAGIDPAAAIAAARDAKIPIFTVGIGSDRRPANVRVSDLVAPARAYPGDSSRSPAICSPKGWPIGRSRSSCFRAPPARRTWPTRARSKPAERVTLGGRRRSRAGEVRDYAGRRRPPRAPAARQGAARGQQRRRRPAGSRRRNRRSQDAACCWSPAARRASTSFSAINCSATRKSSSTSGCNRAAEGASQDANRILTEFPTTPQEMFAYDCIVAFDPDWKALDATRRSTCWNAGWPKRPAG